MVKNNLEAFSFGKNAPPGYEKEESDQSNLEAKYLTDKQMIKKFNFQPWKGNPPIASSIFSNIKNNAKNNAKDGFRHFRKIGTLLCCSVTIIVILVILMGNLKVFCLWLRHTFL